MIGTLALELAGLWSSYRRLNMGKPKRFDEHRWLGDKRVQVVHDMDADGATCDLEEIAAAQAGTVFGPDSLPEARNRGYRPCRSCAPEPRWTDPSPT